MPVLQTSYYIDDELYKKVLSGELQQFGTVIRNSGKIVKLLDEAPMPKQSKQVAKKAVKKQGSAVWQVVKEHKAVAIGVGAAVAVGGAITYAVQSKKEEKELQKEKDIKAFEKALKAYLGAIQKGKLSLKIINNLMESIETLENNKSIKLSKGELNVFGDMIYDYTLNLANDNGFDLKQIKKPSSKKNIVDLQKYLDVQKQIFAVA